MLELYAVLAPPQGAGELLPRGFCFLWNRSLLWTHVTSDLLIGGSYVVISFALATLVHRARREIPFGVVFVAFGLFIIAGGMTHFMEVWTFWQPVYWLSGAVKVVTAVASVSTAAAMPFLVPRVQATVRDARQSRHRELAAERAAALEESNARLAALAEELEQKNAALSRALADAEGARRSAERASRAKSEFLAVMSHELRTPLNAIVGHADLMAIGIAGPVTPKQGEHLTRVRASARHLVGLIDQVLDFGRIEAKRDTPRVERFDVAALARDAAAVLEPLAEEKGLAMRVETPDAPLAVTTDPGKVRQILLNLVSNAIKFTPSGEVAVVAREAAGAGESAVELVVRDTGIGIAAEHLERVFDPFWQVSQGTTREVGGIGLGLSVSRQLARMLGGDVTVTSAPGRGSEFVVRLPRVAPVETGEVAGAA